MTNCVLGFLLKFRFFLSFIACKIERFVTRKIKFLSAKEFLILCYCHIAHFVDYMEIIDFPRITATKFQFFPAILVVF